MIEEEASWKGPEVHLNFDEGYTTPHAPSIRELHTQMQFFGTKGKPWYMALFAEPRDQENGSMIESTEFDEFKSFYKRIKSNVVIRQEGNRTITYMDYCGKTCDVNDPIFKTHALSFFGLQWPETSIFMYKSNVGKYFFLREMRGNEIVKSRLTALYFIAFLNNTQAMEDLRHFEAIVSDHVAKHNADKTKVTTITQHSARGMQMEIARGMKFVFGKLIGGIDGMLILYNAWISHHKTSNVKDHMTEVFSSCFPSITIASSVALGLIFGGMYPTEEFAIFSFYLGLSVVFVYAYLIFYFPALMVWCSSIETPLPLPQHCAKAPKVVKQRPWYEAFLGIDGMLILYNAWISHHKTSNVKDHMTEVFSSCFPSITIASSVALGLIFGGMYPTEEFAIFSFYLGLSVVFVYAYLIHANIDYRHLLPPDSPNNKGVHFMSDVVWFEFFNVLYFIEKPPRFDDPQSYQRFKKMISEFESLPGNINNSGMMWINDFQRHTGMIGNETALDMSRFKDFITHDIYKAWNSGVKYHFDGNTTNITKMLYIGAYEGIKTMMDKAVLLSQCREVAAKYPEFDVVPFDTEVGMVDVVLQIPYITYALEHEPFHDDVHRLTWTFKRILFPVTMSSIASSTVFLPMLLTNVVIFRWLAVINVYGILAGAVHAVLLTPMILALLPSNVTGSTFLCTANRKDDHVAMKTLSN
ncbi:patched family protein [Ancylostoma ceylanicum]|uniref:Patched family protein n=1 Tax=Ancylostoma ceylanicum TaxID=53326 RepID=A0A0D6LSI3_9BILA|nr:patched family protein [Ancylostoma ceylanicum]